MQDATYLCRQAKGSCQHASEFYLCQHATHSHDDMRLIYVYMRLIYVNV